MNMSNKLYLTLMSAFFAWAFFVGVFNQWWFGLIPPRHKEITWLDRPDVTVVSGGKICYTWEIKHKYDSNHQLRVCRKAQ